MRFHGGESSGELSYIDVLARELATEVCIRCAAQLNWKTAALIYEGLEWKYYYCYECRRWFRRHFRYRYAVDRFDDPRTIGLLVRQLESRNETLEAELESASWIKGKISASLRFFQKFLP